MEFRNKGDKVSDVIRQHHALAMGQQSQGTGTYSGTSKGRNPGFKEGGTVAKHGHNTAHDGNMHGGLNGEHHHSHKSHGHGYGTHHHKTGGVVHEDGTLKDGTHSRHSGPSKNQFGDKMPHGGTLGKW